jgi:hypothetical protein
MIGTEPSPRRYAGLRRRLVRWAGLTDAATSRSSALPNAYADDKKLCGRNDPVAPGMTSREMSNSEGFSGTWSI